MGKKSGKKKKKNKIKILQLPVLQKARGGAVRNKTNVSSWKKNSRPKGNRTKRDQGGKKITLGDFGS